MPLTPSGTKQRKKQILLAEDSSIVQKVILAMLNNLGYRADAVGNGREVLQALCRVSYDLVLMDCHMPEMDGYQATLKIRKGEDGSQTTRLPVIALTAYNGKDDREKCLAAGMDDYIAKPVTPLILGEKLSKWLGRENENNFVDSGISSRGIKNLDKILDTSEYELYDARALRKQLMGDDVLARTIIKGFLDDMPHQMAQLKDLVLQGKAEDARRQAHKIKGAMGTIGSPALRQCAYAMEKAGHDNDIERLMKMIPKLETQFMELKELLHQQLLQNHSL